MGQEEISSVVKTVMRKKVEWWVHTCLNMTNMSLRDRITGRNDSYSKEWSETLMVTETVIYYSIYYFAFIEKYTVRHRGSYLEPGMQVIDNTNAHTIKCK